MKQVGNIWYVPMSDLVDRCGINYRTIEDGYQRGSTYWQSIKDPDDQRRRLIRFDTLKASYQKVVKTLLCEGMEPGEYKLAQQGRAPVAFYTLTERLEQVLESGYRRFEGLYTSEDTSRAGRKTTICLARAAGVVELLADYTREQLTDTRSYQPYQEVIDWLNQDNNYDFYFPKGCRYLPLHPVKLKEKVLERTVGRKEPGQPRANDPLPIQEVIHLPRAQNKNRDEFGSDAELMAWIMMAFAHGRKDTKAYVVRKIQEVCQIVGRDVPSASWFSQVLASNKFNQLAAAKRHGIESPLYSRYTHSITMARAMYAGDCWMMDATRVNFIEHATADGDKKRFLVVIAIRDAYSGDIVGIHFDTKEDRWGYTMALKMAVKATGYLPHTLVHDRFPGHLTDEMQQLLDAIERRGTNLVCTHKATGKALLERWFDTMQTVFLAKSRYYYGQGIRSTREYAHRSPEYLLKIRKEANRDGWNFDQAWQEAWKRIEEYRQTPVSHYSRKHKALNLTPQQLHSQSEKPNVIPIEVYEQASLFWLTKVLEIRKATLEFEVHGQRYKYKIFDKELLYRYKKVAVKYDESDLANIMLFAVGADDVVSDFFISEIRLTHDVVMYGPDANHEELAKQQALTARLQVQRQADFDEIVNGSTLDPEYILTMGGRVSKEEYESVESSILYEHMATAQPTPASLTRKRVTKPGPVNSPYDASQINQFSKY